MNTRVLLVSSDLLFSSRVRAAAQRQGTPCSVAGAARAAQEVGEDVGLVLIDLAHTGTESLEELLRDLRRRPCLPHVIAYGPHVDEQLLECARQAGCDEVLTRGQFDQQLSEILRRHVPT